jgi:hypothetical protein
MVLSILRSIVRRMALNTISSTGNPCDILNKDEEPGTFLWGIDTMDNVSFDYIAKNGIPYGYTEMLGTAPVNTMLSSKILNTNDMESQVPLIKFLSDGSGPVDYTKLGNVIKNNESIICIVDQINIMKPGYSKSFSTPDAPSLQPLDYWSPSDMDANGNPAASPVSLIGKMLKDGILLTQAELFKPSEFSPSTALPPPGEESLIYLYNFDNNTSKNITSQQLNRRILLESKNMKFFGAFLSEYCYYRSRYNYLLKEYFKLYQQEGTGTREYVPPSISEGSVHNTLFAGKGAAINQYLGDNITKVEHLRVYTYHMAILNTKITDMRMLLGHIASFYATVTDNIKSKINDSSFMGSNTRLSEKLTALNSSSQNINDYLTEKDFHEAAMEYNATKNRYSNVLLGLYAFLNIAAVAMIIHISSS